MYDRLEPSIHETIRYHADTVECNIIVRRTSTCSNIVMIGEWTHAADMHTERGSMGSANESTKFVPRHKHSNTVSTRVLHTNLFH